LKRLADKVIDLHEYGILVNGLSISTISDKFVNNIPGIYPITNILDCLGNIIDHKALNFINVSFILDEFRDIVVATRTRPH
jgi:hypothetical protein